MGLIDLDRADFWARDNFDAAANNLVFDPLCINYAIDSATTAEQAHATERALRAHGRAFVALNPSIDTDAICRDTTGVSRLEHIVRCAMLEDKLESIRTIEPNIPGGFQLQYDYEQLGILPVDDDDDDFDIAPGMPSTLGGDHSGQDSDQPKQSDHQPSISTDADGDCVADVVADSDAVAMPGIQAPQCQDVDTESQSSEDQADEERYQEYEIWDAMICDMLEPGDPSSAEMLSGLDSSFSHNVYCYLGLD